MRCPALLLATVLLATVLLVLPTSPAGAQSDFIRGDCREDGQVDLADATWVIQLAFISGALPSCVDACDPNGDGVYGTVSDGVYLILYLFEMGPPPPVPFPDCGPAAGTSNCVTYDCGADPPPTEPAYLLHADAVIGGISAAVEVPVRLDVGAVTPVLGASFGIAHDPAVLAAVAVHPGPALGIDPVDYFQGNAVSNGLTVAWISSILIAFPTLGPGTDHEIVRAVYTAVGPVGASTAITLVDDLGDPPVPNRILTEHYTSREPAVAAGSVTLSESFRRGDVDGDGLFVGVGDAIYTLGFAFAAGPQPPCMDAADFDDDGTFDPLVEAIGILTFAYLGGAPPPPPGLSCGPDPTEDVLGCLVTPPCP